MRTLSELEMNKNFGNAMMRNDEDFKLYWKQKPHS